MKKNLPLIAALAIPALMILLVAAAIYLPSFFVKPKYSFLYVSGDDYYSGQYSVVNGSLVQVTSTYPRAFPADEPQAGSELFVYDPTTDQSRSISFMDAQALSLDPSTQSPDGFQVVSGNDGGGFFPFGGGGDDSGDWYLKGHDTAKKINVQTVGDSYDDLTFLGWVNQ